MDKLSIDLETYSSTDLSKSGVYKYVESPDFEILLFGYSIDNNPVEVIDLASGEEIPENIFDAILDNSVEKWAHNASFERICLSRYFINKGISIQHSDAISDISDGATYLKPEGWKCTMVWASYLGLPLSLKEVGNILGLEEQKIEEGAELIHLFCRPNKSKDSSLIRNYPDTYPTQWELFKEYNRRDVQVEMAIQEAFKPFSIPGNIWEEYYIDQRINDYGVLLDSNMIHQAINMCNRSKTELLTSLQEITELKNPGSPAQMKTWLIEHGIEISSLDKKTVEAIIEKCPDEKIKQVLLYYQQISKSSVAKYQAMLNAMCLDDRARGMFQFYGAHTGRWAGRLIQVHNLPQNQLPDITGARDLVCSANESAIKLIYGNIPTTLSNLIRTAFIPKPGTRFIVADYSAIEARILAWLAKETWREAVFSVNGDIYCEAASKLYGVNVEKHGANSHLRKYGKVAELALGYGGSVGALVRMGALEKGLTESDLPRLVSTWRQSNPRIVEFWHKIGNAAIAAVKTHSTQISDRFEFRYKNGFLFISLPSGRRLSYVHPEIIKNQFGSDCITYEAVVTGKWGKCETYGGKLVENLVQAIARDLLCNAIRTLQTQHIVMHVHDELVIEAPFSMTVDEICQKMCVIPPWADGLILHAEGFETDFYRK